MPKFQLVVAGGFLSVSLLVWLAFLRPVPVRTAVGVVRSKTFMQAGEYVQYQPGTRQSFRTPTKIQMAEHYVVGIQVDGRSSELRYAATPGEAASLEIGQTVTLEYQERGLPPFWRRAYVLELKRPD